MKCCGMISVSQLIYRKTVYSKSWSKDGINFISDQIIEKHRMTYEESALSQVEFFCFFACGYIHECMLTSH